MTAVRSDDPLVLQTRRVAAARAQVTALEEELGDARRAFEEGHAALIAAVQTAQAACAADEQALRELTLQRYQETGDQHPAPGLGIRLVKAVEYDAGQALAWAKQSGLALQLDRKAFEKIAIATPVPGATVVERPQATIAADLERALAVEDTGSPGQPAHTRADQRVGSKDAGLPPGPGQGEP